MKTQITRFYKIKVIWKRISSGITELDEIYFNNVRKENFNVGIWGKAGKSGKSMYFTSKGH
ncbi:hypothetical protein ACXYRQ_02410 [Mycoplasma sp. 394]